MAGFFNCTHKLFDSLWEDGGILFSRLSIHPSHFASCAGVSNKHCLLTFLVLDNESLLYSINIQTVMHIPGSCFRIYIK